MTIPITLRCECGEVVSADLGDSVTCSCGRRYDTSTLPPAQFGRVRAAQLRIRVYTQIGIAFVIGLAALGWVLWGIKGAALTGPLGGLIWFRFISPRYKRRWLTGLGELPNPNIKASD